MTAINDDTVQSDSSTEALTLDYEVQSYQDELDIDPSKTDPVMSEENDDPVAMLGVPAGELASELDKRDLDDPHTTDDMREQIEDLDQDADDPTK